ncbi:MAG: SDR family NAD(P)-dependent oxidoreductase [Nannocystaceae bacterium]
MEEGLDVGLLIANHMWAPHTPPKFLDVSLERLDRMLAINAQAYTRLAHTFGRRFVERGRGGMILVSSSAALVTAPFTASYAANKAYQLALGEALWFEFQGTGVDIEVLTPGLTQTKLVGMAGFDQRLMMGVDRVVAESLAKLGRRHLVIPGLFNKLVVGIQTRLLPRKRMINTVGGVMRRALRVEQE